MLPPPRGIYTVRSPPPRGGGVETRSTGVGGCKIWITDGH
jgi:hypothetical protein